MRLERVQFFPQPHEDVMDVGHVEDWAVFVERLHEAAHVRPLVMVGQVHGQRHGCDGTLDRVGLVPNLDRVTKVFDPNAVNRNLPVVRLILGVFQVLDGLDRHFRQRMIITKSPRGATRVGEFSDLQRGPPGAMIMDACKGSLS